MDHSHASRARHGRSADAPDCRDNTRSLIDPATINAVDVTAITRTAVQMALDGNLDAMRLVLEAACGSPHDATLECLALELNLREMNTAHACAVALDDAGVSALPIVRSWWGARGLGNAGVLAVPVVKLPRTPCHAACLALWNQARA